MEINDAARGVLADRFPYLTEHGPDKTLFRDLTEVSGDDLRAAGAVPERTVVTAGWPCQGNSVAGRRGGMADPRSGLWVHVARLLAELRPRWFIGENVPGLLSVNHGRDFATVVEDLAGIGMELCWRILDARYFGVPQRRRRLIVVGHLGDQRTAPAQVLLEPESLCWHPAPRRQTRPNPATNPRSSTAAHRQPSPTDPQTGASRETSPETIANRPEAPPRPQHYCTQAGHIEVGPDMARAVRVAGVFGDHTHTLTAVGHDASEDGTGRGTPVVGFAWQAGGKTTAAGALEYDRTPTLPKSQTLAVAYTSTAQRPVYVPDVAHSLLSHGGNDKHDPTMITYVAQHASALLASGGDRGHRIDAETASGGHLIVQPGVPEVTDVIVRRLTPLECERLQGLPDGWTATRNGQPQKDSPRYQQLGNSVAVPVLEWVARRVASVNATKCTRRIATATETDCGERQVGQAVALDETRRGRCLASRLTNDQAPSVNTAAAIHVDECAAEPTVRAPRMDDSAEGPR